LYIAYNVLQPGAVARHTLGLAVFSGMLDVTLFGFFVTPVF
jgi:multidrug efflux pump subunit AcrB